MSFMQQQYELLKIVACHWKRSSNYYNIGRGLTELDSILFYAENTNDINDRILAYKHYKHICLPVCDEWERKIK